jgi:hypothetical protein
MIVKGRKSRRVMSKADLRRRSRVMADEDVEVDDVEDFENFDEGGEADVDVAPEASELLFEAQDVAELIAEVTEKPVEVNADEDTVVFSVDGVEFTVEADGNEEEVMESRRIRNKKSVRASRAIRRPVSKGAHAEGTPARRTVASSRKVRRPAVKASTAVRSARPAQPARRLRRAK